MPNPNPKYTLLLQLQHDPPRQPISNNNPHHDSDILPHVPWCISILIQHPLPGNQTLIRQLRLPHALTPITHAGTRIRPLAELVNHHILKHILLVIPVVKDVFVKDVEDAGLDHEAVDGHPEAVGKGDECEGDDEGGKEGGHKDDEAFGGQEVEEEPEDPGEEG
jgi:hypothetical protein